MTPLPPPPGLCECGCGQAAPIASHTRRERGVVKGQQMRFIHGHYKRPSPGPEYVEEDRGYETPCWIWQRSIHKYGYGLGHRDGKTIRAHKLVYERHRGPVPEGLTLDHLCRQRECVNPDHLEPVTQLVNSRRGAMSKLTLTQVHEIIASDEPDRVLAERYAIDRATVWYYRSGRWPGTGKCCHGRLPTDGGDPCGCWGDVIEEHEEMAA